MEFIKQLPWKKIIKVGGAVASMAIAAMGALSDQKKAAEFEQMKKDLEYLKNQ